jgi:hypothetical protein
VSLSCYLHPRSSAQDRCEACRRAICPACVVVKGVHTRCRSCAEAASRRARVTAVAVGAAVASAIALAAFFLA